MEDFKKIIASNLKALRQERKLSLDSVAKMTGVSKSMISQIEKGEVNPTISIMWKLANGFKVSFSKLMSEEDANVEVVKPSEEKVLYEDEGRVKCYPVFTFDSERRFEIFQVVIEENGVVENPGHNTGTQEFITVFEGVLIIETNNRSYRLEAGESIRFRADVAHYYYVEEECKFSQVVYYPE